MNTEQNNQKPKYQNLRDAYEEFKALKEKDVNAGHCKQLQPRQYVNIQEMEGQDDMADLVTRENETLMKQISQGGFYKPQSKERRSR